MIKPDFTQAVPDELGAVHFIGIGGSGMSGIARILIGMGHAVTGSDLRDSSNVATLRELGAKIYIGHDESHLGNPDTVVVTSDDVKAPAVVRFGWAEVPDGNLFNKNGLPASPFHTGSK